jgi:GDPmannose 4,6-dehydratase
VDLDWQPYVLVNQADLRPADVDLLIGDATKAKTKLGWEPTVTFEQMIEKMVEADLAALKKQHHL